MKLVFTFLITILIIFLIGYGIKLFFDARKNRNSETSNRPIVKAISALLAGFLMMVGFSSYVPDFLVQFANEYLGLNLKISPQNQLITTSIFIVFCIAVSFVIYTYYKNRHQMYLQEHTRDKTDGITESFIIDNRKAKIKNQTIIKDNTGDLYF